SVQGKPADKAVHGGVPLMTSTNRSRFRGDLSPSDIERLYPALAARLDYGELTYSERLCINEQVSLLDDERRRGTFNGLEYFYFRFPEQAALMTAFLLRQGFHRIVPGSTQPATPEQVEAEWRRRASEREAVLAWMRETKMYSPIVLAYRFERS